MELDGTRAMHASGPNPIAYAEIEAWARLTGWPLAPHHVATLRAMDAALLGHVAAEAKKAADREMRRR